MSGHGQAPTHGAALWLRRGVLPAGKRHITRAVDAILAEYQRDLGGDLSAGQKIIMQLIRRELVYLLLCDEWLDAQPCVVTIKGEILAPLGSFYLACSNSVQRACEKLGLTRVSIADDLEGYLTKKAAGSPQDGQTPPAMSPRQGKGKKPVCARPESEQP
jgi:hypothetical protein